MDSKESRTIAVPLLTLDWWRQLAHDDPQDLQARIEQYWAAVSDNKAEAVEPATNMLGATGSPVAGSAPLWVGVDLAAADFSDALMWLKEGKRVFRAGWNGKGQWVRLRFESGAFGWDDSNKVYRLGDTLMLKNAQGRLIAWVPSMGDLMATDWNVVSDDAVDNMPPHLSQMLEELEQLSLRLKELNAYIEGEEFKRLAEEAQGQLKLQAKHMADYQEVLVTRVAAAS